MTVIAVLGTSAVVGVFNLSSIVDILKSNALSVVVFALSEKIKLLLAINVKFLVEVITLLLEDTIEKSLPLIVMVFEDCIVTLLVFAILILALFTSHKTSFLSITLAKFLVKLDAVPKYSEAASGIAGRYPKIAGSCADNESKKNPKTQSPSLGVPYRLGVFKG